MFVGLTARKGLLAVMVVAVVGLSAPVAMSAFDAPDAVLVSHTTSMREAPSRSGERSELRGPDAEKKGQARLAATVPFVTRRSPM